MLILNSLSYLFNKNYLHQFQGGMERKNNVYESLHKLKLENQQLKQENQKLRDLVNIDELTRIYNRRYFNECLKTEWQRMAREKKPLSIISLDLDCFKLYNDTYGHIKGDMCLWQVAQTIVHCLKRPADIAARYGGEEFAVILPQTADTGAINIAEKIRIAIEDLAIEHINSQVSLKLVTVSLGVASIIPNRISKPINIIQAADKALYEAKKQGRNLVTQSHSVLT